MKILLLANYINDEQESMQRFAAFMAQGLAQAGHQVRVLRPPSIVGRARSSSTGFGKWLGYFDKFAVFPPVLRSAIKQADVVHICDHANAFYTRHLQSVPHVVTCHDLLAVRSALGEIAENPTRWTGKQLQRMILNGLVRAQHIACVSDATRRDMLLLAPQCERRVSRIYNSLAYPYSPMDKREAAGRLRALSLDPAQPFLLHVGGNQWYKNRLGVLRILAALRAHLAGRPLHLVMAGKPWTPEMRQFIRENALSAVAHELTAVSNEDLRALYSSAALMLFPSLQEGFGWPIVEAQACGCPVAVADRAPMNEVAGAAAVYIDVENPQSAVAVLNQALANRDALVERSLVNAARFRSSMVEGYVSLYGKVVEEMSATKVRRDTGQRLAASSACSIREVSR